jgi:predicted metal-binding membrane protein
MASVVLTRVQGARRRLVTAGVFGSLAVAAWVATVSKMNGAAMDGGRFSVGSFGFFVALWVLMMGAMMFPSVWPAVAVYGLVARRRTAAGAQRVVHSAAFVGGYLGCWALTGLAAFGLLATVRAFGLEGVSPVALARYGVAPVALLAAVYEATPFKRLCLRQCRGPLAFFMSHWRDGIRGALAIGARHGAYCVGCCWMLMLVLLSLGAMSVTWMAAVSVAIAVEKLAPAAFARHADRLLIAGLVALALIAAVKPGWLPGMGGAAANMSSM